MIDYLQGIISHVVQRDKICTFLSGQILITWKNACGNTKHTLTSRSFCDVLLLVVYRCNLSVANGNNELKPNIVGTTNPITPEMTTFNTVRNNYMNKTVKLCQKVEKSQFW